MSNNANKRAFLNFESPLNSTPNQTGSPERNLMMAILERAILDFVGNRPSDIKSAEDWIFSDAQEPQEEFSFAWVCSELDLDPKSIAAAIKAMPKRGNNRVAPWYFNKQQNKAA